MTVIKKEEETKENVMKIAKKNISSLGTFIRLVDYMVIETQVKINQEGADLVYQEMLQEDRKAGIGTKIDYDDKGMVFNPTEGEFIQQFEKMLGDMMQTTGEIARVIQHPQFNQYTQGLVSDSGLKFKDIVDKSEDYKLTKSELNKKFISDFAQLHKDVAKFEECRIVRDFETSFDFDEFKRAGLSLKKIQEKLDELKKWDALVSTCIRAQTIRGIIFGGGKELRDRLSGKVKAALQSIRVYLTELAEAKGLDISDEFRGIRKNLTKPMGSLSEYVDYVKSLNDSKARLAEQEAQRGILDEMNSILRKTFKNKDMNTFGESANENNALQVKYETIVEEMEKLAKDIALKEVLVSERQAEMLTLLDKNIIDVKEKITELISKINVGAYIQASTPSPDACNDLEKLKKKFDESKKRAESYMDAQETLEQQLTPMTEIEEFDKKWEARYKLWKTRDNWEQDHAVWFEETFQGQDALEIEQKLKDYEKDITWLKQNLPRDSKDEVLEKIAEDIRSTVSMKDLILDLGNKALLDRHMIKIFSLLPEGNTYSPNRTFTLSELIADGILEVKDKVGEISSTASGEFAISQTLEEIKKIWATMEFIVMPYRDFKDKFILGTIEEIMIQLEDDQVSIQTMLGSKNVQEIRADVER
jgi:dynein heavy chain